MPRLIILIFFFLLSWQISILLLQLPDYILPSPYQTFYKLYQQKDLIAHHAMFTFIETSLGFMFGILFGCVAGLSITFFRPLKVWFLPILIMSQAVPTFAIAPLIVIWFGYGLASKILITTIMIFFPVTSALVDGLSQTPQAWLDLAQTMNASRWRTFVFIRIPAALPTLSSGIKIAAVVAPIGAIVGEWVGSSKGLGYLMLNANARLQTDDMFAALSIIVLLSLALYFIIDKLLQKWVWWKNN